MSISFTPLAKSHFSLLLKWLNSPHMKKWWDPDIQWTPTLIEQKYTNYVLQYKIQDGVKKPIHPYIICKDTISIGYIQIYNAYDFPRSKPLIELSSQLAALDIFIGEQSALHKGLGAQAINQFLEANHDLAYTHVFVDPDKENKAAIRTYEQAGFKRFKEHEDTNEVWMLR